MENLVSIPVSNEDKLLVFLLNNRVGLRATFVKREAANPPVGLLVNSRTSISKRLRYFENSGRVYALLYVEPDRSNPFQNLATIIRADSASGNEASARLLNVLATFADDPGSQLNYKGQAQLLLFEAMAHKNAETKEHFQEAIRLSEQAIALDPTLAQALNCKGASQAALGDNTAAIATYLTAIKADPRCMRPWMNLGNRYTALDVRDRALFAYRISVEQPPLWEGDEELQAEALTKLVSHTDQSVEANHLLLARNQEIDKLFSDHQLNNRGSAHQAVATGVRLGRKGEWEKALEFFSVAAAENADDIVAHNNRAHALNQLGRHAEAIAVCDEVLARYPDYFTVMQTKAEALLMEARVEESLNCLNKILYSDGSNPAVNYFKALIEDELGALTQAAASYGKLLHPELKSCRPQREYAKRRIQEFLYYHDRSVIDSSSYASSLLGGRRHHVNDLLDCLNTDDVSSAPPEIAAGLNFYRDGDLESAIRTFDSALTSESNQVNVQLLKALCLIQRDGIESIDAAVGSCDQILIGDPDLVDALVIKADALMQKARLSGAGLNREQPFCAQALECFNRVVAHDPRHPGALYSKALAEDAVGAGDAASKTFRQFVVVAPDALASHLQYARTRLHHMEFWSWRRKMCVPPTEA